MPASRPLRAELRDCTTEYLGLAPVRPELLVWHGRCSNGAARLECLYGPLANPDTDAALLERFETVRFADAPRARTARPLLRGFQRLPLVLA